MKMHTTFMLMAGIPGPHG